MARTPLPTLANPPENEYDEAGNLVSDVSPNRSLALGYMTKPRLQSISQSGTVKTISAMQIGPTGDQGGNQPSGEPARSF